MMFDYPAGGFDPSCFNLAGGWILGLYFPFDLIIGRA